MTSPFRPAPFWQAALSTLPDAAFFDLMRSVLGTVKTPFNKQNLVEELSRFIIRPEIQANIAAYIDNNDRRVIAAIALLGEPAPGELESFFSGEYSYAELHGLLLNLEERLIIYRFRDNGVLRIALNPRLESILAPHAAAPMILFPSIDVSLDASLPKGKGTVSERKTAPGGNGAAVNAALDDRTLAALFSFLLNNEFQIKDDGKGAAFVFRKKAAEQCKAFFPGIDIDSICAAFIVLGLIRRQGEELVPDEAKIASFKTLSGTGRYEYFAGAAALFLCRGTAAFQSRSLLNRIVRLIRNFAAMTQNASAFPEATMIKLAELFRRQESSQWGFVGELPSAPLLLRALVAAGLFCVTIIDGKNCYCPLYPETARAAARDGAAKSAKGAQSASVAKKDRPVIAMDSDFSCLLYPEIGFGDAIDLASFFTVKETGTTARFALSRDSVVRGFDRGYSADYLWRLLEQLSGGRVPDALKWNLNDWEKRWKEVSLNQGVILTLGAERNYLAKTGPLATLIKRTLAPGVFLLSSGIEEANDALREAGVDIVGRPQTEPRGETDYEAKSGLLFESEAVSPETFSMAAYSADEHFAAGTAVVDNAGGTASANSGNQLTVDQLKESFRKVLQNMKLSKQEKEELEARIDRRIIVGKTQLKDTSLRYERLEARALDYVGKTGIVKQAIVSGSLLELSCLNGEKILGLPESLDKKGGEMILSVRPREGGETVKLPLGKISLIRRIKQSIFGE